MKQTTLKYRTLLQQSLIKGLITKKYYKQEMKYIKKQKQ